jgi:hypothetical protein
LKKEENPQIKQRFSQRCWVPWQQRAGLEYTQQLYQLTVTPGLLFANDKGTSNAAGGKFFFPDPRDAASHFL